MGSFKNASSAAYTAPVSKAESAPASSPQTTQPSNPQGPINTGWAGTGNSGPTPRMYRRAAPAVALANATGTRLRGFHSNNISSTARRTAAMGEANVADIPAAAPATSSVLRSTLVNLKNCAINDPIAPPVMMIGPSAPHGPPLPMEIADDIGFRIASLGSTRLPLIRMDSSASGMPCPRILSEP